jgi:hypothetical protein
VPKIGPLPHAASGVPVVLTQQGPDFSLFVGRPKTMGRLRPPPTSALGSPGISSRAARHSSARFVQEGECCQPHSRVPQALGAITDSSFNREIAATEKVADTAERGGCAGRTAAGWTGDQVSVRGGREAANSAAEVAVDLARICPDPRAQLVPSPRRAHSSAILWSAPTAARRGTSCGP